MAVIDPGWVAALAASGLAESCAPADPHKAPPNTKIAVGTVSVGKLVRVVISDSQQVGKIHAEPLRPDRDRRVKSSRRRTGDLRSRWRGRLGRARGNAV